MCVLLSNYAGHMPTLLFLYIQLIVCVLFFVIQRQVLFISISKDNILFNLDLHQNRVLLLHVLYFHKQANKCSQHTQCPTFSLMPAELQN